MMLRMNSVTEQFVYKEKTHIDEQDKIFRQEKTTKLLQLEKDEAQTSKQTNVEQEFKNKNFNKDNGKDRA